jgi:predicted outer membrane repeat protein
MQMKSKYLLFMLVLISLLFTTVGVSARPLYASGDFVWAKRMGGTLEEQGNSIAVDSNGNIYTTGAYKGTANFGAISLTSAGDYDIFVTKMDSSGNFVWAKSMGGASGEDSSRGIAVDSGGNVYTTGHFHVFADFDPDPVNVSNLNSTGPYDMFISKLDNNGNFVWAKNIGGAGADSSVSIAVTNSNVYITGDYVNGGNGDDIYVSKFDTTNGNAVWARTMGGTGIDYGLGIAIDSNGNVYTTGAFTGTVDFDPGFPANNLKSIGLRDIFLSKLDTDGNFVWAQNMGDTGEDFGYGIALNASGSNVYITGDYNATASFGGIILTSAGGFDIFVANYDSNGNVVWAKSMGGAGTDYGMGIAVDLNGNVYTTGAFSNTSAFGTTSLTSAGLYDIFVNRLNSDGAYSWAKGMGGTLDDAGGGIAVNSTGIYTIGAFRNVVDFDPGVNTYNLTSAGGADVFVSKLEYYTGVYYAKPIASGIGNCQSWANACALQSALVTAANGDTIWVAQGTHKPTAGADRAATFQLKFGVAVYGGFAGTETALDQRNPAVNVTILSGDIGVAGNSDNSYHVVMATTGSTLDGFTITRGNANGVYPDNSGGGMYNFYTSPHLANVIFLANTAFYGGGMYNNGESSLTLTSVTFKGNQAFTTGGGMHNESSSPVLTNVEFTGNSAGDSGGGMTSMSGSPALTGVVFSGNSATRGGGMYNTNSDPALTNVNFIGNTATDSGGGIYFDGNRDGIGISMLTNVTFDSNTAQFGGGMFNNLSSTPKLTTVSFNSNTATGGGGMYNNSASNPILSDVTFSGNSAKGGGGGMYNSASSPTMTNVTFSGNSAGWSGGGMDNEDSSPTLNTVSFVNNHADSYPYYGGGMFNRGDYNGVNIKMTNVSFLGNTANIGAGMYNDSSNPSLTNIIFGDNTAKDMGGGMGNNASFPTLTNVSFSNNFANSSGGGMYNNASSPTLTNVTFSSNHALAYDGGGMINLVGSNPALTNVTFSGNSAHSFGGGIKNVGLSNPILKNVTFSGNTANDGGGMYNDFSNAQIFNTIFWGNTATTAGAQIYNDSSTPILNDNVIQGGCPDGSTCTHIISADPMLGTLGNYGGYTQTIPLLAGSSAINTGNDALCPATDQRGIARPQGAHCDIGAYEFNVYRLFLPLVLR